MTPLRVHVDTFKLPFSNVKHEPVFVTISSKLSQLVMHELRVCTVY